MARIREELSQQEGRSSGIAQQIAGSRKRIAAIDEELQLLRRTLEETGGEIQRLAANAEGIIKQYLELRSRQSALQADIAGRQADLAALEESVRQAQSRMEDRSRRTWTRDAGGRTRLRRPWTPVKRRCSPAGTGSGP